MLAWLNSLVCVSLRFSLFPRSLLSSFLYSALGSLASLLVVAWGPCVFTLVAEHVAPPFRAALYSPFAVSSPGPPSLFWSSLLFTFWEPGPVLRNLFSGIFSVCCGSGPHSLGIPDKERPGLSRYLGITHGIIGTVLPVWTLIVLGMPGRHTRDP